MNFKLGVAVAATAILFVAGCGSSSKSGSSATTTLASGKQSVCAARASLKTSVAALASPALLTGGKAGIQAALDTVKTNLDAVSSSAKSVYKPQVDAVKSAVNDLGTALGDFGNGNATKNLQAAGTAITSIGSTTATLVSSLQAECPSS